MKIDWESFKKHKSSPIKNQFPTGTRVYKGYQGKGKTLSLIHDVMQTKIEFPDCVIFSNVKFLRDNFDYNYFDDNLGLKKALEFSNGSKGVLVVVDEAQLFFNKKDGISIDVFTAICQQRKDRRRLVFTSQIWEDLDISLRKQVKEIVCCNNILNGLIQINDVKLGETLTYDKLKGEYVAEHSHYEIYKHNDELYRSYDTYQKIITNKEYNRVMTGGDATRPPVITLNNKLMKGIK